MTGIPCPCDEQRQYARCCAPLHRGESLAKTAVELMRSRYSAYALEIEAYILATWHPDTRPQALQFGEGAAKMRWLKLKLLRQEAHGDTATVEFEARYRVGGGSAQRMHERSRFVFEADRWYYVDGDVR